MTQSDTAPSGPQSVNCRHCGAANQVDAEANPDWQCSTCERYQDTMACPMCGQPVRISLHAELGAEPAAAAAPAEEETT